MYDASKETDKDVLRALNKHLQEELLFAKKALAQVNAERIKDEEICKKLAEELFNLKKRIFDSKQEKKANKARNQKKRQKGNRPHNKSKNSHSFEEDIELDEEIIDYKIDNEKCSSCNNNLKKINANEESSEFEVIERRYILKRHKRQKYTCKSCETIVTAPGGIKLTTGGEFSIQIATQIACDKFEDHLPLERQRKQMKRAGLNIEVKTLYGLTEHLYNRLFDLGEMIRQDVLSENWIHIDESPIDFYNPNKSKGYVWSMSNPRGAYYQFESTRAGEVAREMLKGYEKGAVVTDGYGGYNFLDNKKGIKHAFCWAHVRRKFFEAMNHDEAAEDIVDLIDELYAVESEAESLDHLERLRSQRSYKIVKSIDDWIEKKDGHHLESSSLGKAIKYYENLKDGLHHFLSDKNVPIDNNMAERRQRCPVMGRKNFLHFKSINGADVGVLFYSIIESCKSNGLNARAYINDMAHKSAKDERLESPYQYSSRLNQEITERLAKELAQLK